jgi:predicted GH43/DUF377 family glycosyl hydrolase
MPTSSAGSADALFRRHVANPMLAPNRWPYAANAVMNAGAVAVDGGTVLLCRVEDRRGMSHLTVARSADGVTNWVVDDTPLLAPYSDLPEESWGVEDPRLTRVDELDAWVITYTSFGPGGPGVSMATTRDFRTVDRLGVVRPPEDKNGALLPRRVGGQFILFHRPVAVAGQRGDIWLSRSPDLHTWSDPEPVMSGRSGGWWDTARIGMGPTPLETPEGWLVVYHGVRQTVAGSLYRAGLALLDLDDPSKVLHRSDEWVLSPTEPYELLGDVPNVVFPCGLVHDADTDLLRLYYGAADTCVALATASLPEVLGHLRGVDAA